MNKKILIFFLALICSISLSNAIRIITVNETELISLKLRAIDEDGDKLVYSFTEPLDQNGQWQTKYGDAGEYKITVIVSDGKSETSNDILLVVKKKNIAPSIDLFAPKETQITIDEGKKIDFDVKASDLNKDLLVYKWELDGKSVSEKEAYSYESDYFDAGEHKVKVIVSDGEAQQYKEWIVSVNKVDRKVLLGNIKDIVADEGDVIKLDLPDFKEYNLDYKISEPIGDDNYWQTGYDDAKIYNVEITIEDREFKASKNVKVEVRDKDRAPVLKPIANTWLRENQKVRIELEAYDLDDDKIEFSVDNLPSGASLKDNIFEWIVDYDAVKKGGIIEKALDKFHLLYKPFRVRFTAKSKGLEAKQSVWIIVKDVNRAPMLEDIPQITVNEGGEVIIKPEVNDPDGDIVTYSYSGWIDSNNYTTDYDDAGTYKVKVVVSDGFLTIEKYATIEVKDVNRAPILGELESMAVNENERLELSLKTSDPEGDSINISVEPLLRNSSIEDNIFTWIPDYDTVTADSEVFPINFKANDGKDETIKQANITVYNVNRLPKIIAASKSDLTIKKNQKVKFEIDVEDPDGDELGYLWKFSLLEQYKGGSAIMRNFTTPGNKNVKVVVSDGKEEIEYIWKVKVV